MNNQTFRQSKGGRIDRKQVINFSFNGTDYKGYKGDTLASALIANGVRVVGRGFKFHRPRGIFSAGAEEPNALVTVGTGGLEEASVRATMQPLYDNLVARSQNCWPNVNFDVGRSADVLAGLFPAGFYNKTFKWPNWHWYEWLIRRASGIAKLAPADDPDCYAHKNFHCELLIVGSGPAGIAAALAAVGTQARVVLVEQDTELGGSLLWQDVAIDAGSDENWLSESLATLAKSPNIVCLPRTTASAYFDHDFVLLTQRLREQNCDNARHVRERLWKVRAKQIIFATGAYEQPLMFPNNDRPGIMQASAIRQYLNRFAVTAGKRVAIATNNDSAYQTALDLHRADVEVMCVVDARPNPQGEIVSRASNRGIRVFKNAVVSNTKGGAGIRSIKIHNRNRQDRMISEYTAVECDCLGVSGGWQPVSHLFSQARGKLHYDETQAAFLPKSAPDNINVVGAANGMHTFLTILREGEEKSKNALYSLGLKSKASGINVKFTGEKRNACHTEHISTSSKAQKQWVDYQHDVTLRDVDIAISENFTSVEHLKRYTAVGMAVDQGKTSNFSALAALATRTNRPIGDIGTTTFRPFFTPVTLGSIAAQRRGEFYSAMLSTPMLGSHVKLNATFQDYGPWRRAGWYPNGQENKQQAITREVKTVRNAVGIFDGSPLGKIEVRGKDAETFLNRLYVNNVSTLKPGRSRYVLMTNENGVIIDDGILCRLTGDHFLAHTSSAGAIRIYSWMESWLQGEWPELDVLLTPVSTQWANIAVSGPRARQLMERIGIEMDFDNSEFPHMSFRVSEINGIPIRIMRASFTGENGYEINIPADYGRSLWDGFLERGHELGVTPIGLESLAVLRTEKGYLHVGGDTDGASTPLDIGWEPMIEKKREFFIGKRSLFRLRQQSDDRFHFVGLMPVENSQSIEPGEHVVAVDFTQAPAPTQGYVTSACFSPTLKHCIALGLVENGRKRLGEQVKLYNRGKTQVATIVKPTFYDPEGEKLRA